MPSNNFSLALAKAATAVCISIAGAAVGSALLGLLLLSTFSHHSKPSFAESIPLPFLSRQSALAGSVTQIGTMESGIPIKKIRFDDAADETLVTNTVYLVITPEASLVNDVSLDAAFRFAGASQAAPVNFFGYKYSDVNASQERSNLQNLVFAQRFPGQFFASAKSRLDGFIESFETQNGILFQSATTLHLAPDSLYIFIVNEPGALLLRGKKIAFSASTSNSSSPSASFSSFEAASSSADSQSPANICGNSLLEPEEECDGLSLDHCTSDCLRKDGLMLDSGPIEAVGMTNAPALSQFSDLRAVCMRQASQCRLESASSKKIFAYRYGKVQMLFTGPTDGSSPLVSANGKYITFNGMGDTVLLFDLEARRYERYALDASNKDRVFVNADGRSLVYGVAGGIVIIDRETKKTTVIERPADAAPVRQDGENDADFSRRSITYGRTADRVVQMLSDDGQRIAYYVRRPDNSFLSKIHDRGTGETIETPAENREAVYDRDLQTLLYVRSAFRNSISTIIDYTQYRFDAGGTQDRPAFFGTQYQSGLITRLSHDGRYALIHVPASDAADQRDAVLDMHTLERVRYCGNSPIDDEQQRYEDALREALSDLITPSPPEQSADQLCSQQARSCAEYPYSFRAGWTFYSDGSARTDTLDQSGRRSLYLRSGNHALPFVPSVQYRFSALANYRFSELTQNGKFAVGGNPDLKQIGIYDLDENRFFPLDTGESCFYMNDTETPLLSSDNAGRFVAVSPAGIDESTIILIDRSDGTRVSLDGKKAMVSPDGTHVAYLENTDAQPLRVILYEIAAKTKTHLDLDADANNIVKLFFSPSGNHLLIISNQISGGVSASSNFLYDVRRGADVTPFDAQSWGTPQIIGISPDGITVLTGEDAYRNDYTRVQRAAIFIADKSYAHQREYYPTQESLRPDFKPFGVDWQYFGGRELYILSEQTCPSTPVCADIGQ